MRLTLKLVSTVVIGLFVLIAIDALLSMRREVELYDLQMEPHAVLLGRALSPVIVSAWRDEGEEQAAGILDQATRGEQLLDLRLVSWGGEARWLPHVPLDLLAPAMRGEEVSLKHVGPDGAGYRYTYVPIVVDTQFIGAIEMSEPLASRDRYLRGSAMRTLVLIAVSVFVGSIAIRLVALRLVGRPLHLLAEKARRVGSGDLGGPLVLRGRDELAELADALNRMCERLVVAREEMEKETAAKIEAIEQARHADRLRTIGELAAGVAHQLGTPLNVISGRADMIAGGEHPSDRTAEYAGIIRIQASRMDEIIQQLLTFGRRGSVKTTSMDLLEVVRHTVDALEPLAQQHGAILRIDDVAVPAVDANPTEIQQVISNLILNAIQAMPRGGTVDLRIESGPARRPGDPEGVDREYVHLEVRDSGDGMSEATMARLFDPFFTTKSVGEGTGLGLSIARSIVEEHGGWIDVTSEVGVGSSFVVHLPTPSS